MGLESSFNFIDDLDSSNPAAGDNVSEGDDHLRGVKNAVKGSFPSLGSTAVTSTAAELNVLDGVNNFLDEDDMASNSATAIASQQSIKAYVDNTVPISTKILEIGDWDMDTDASAIVAHGLTYADIRRVNVLIRNDADTSRFMYPIDTAGNQYIAVNSLNINLVRETGGFMDSTDYNATTYNRGWILVDYV